MAFSRFGDVIDCHGVDHASINQGYAERYGDMANVDTGSESGTVGVHVFVANPRPMPIAIALMERHPLGSQMFIPMQDRRWLVLVCDDPLDERSYFAFAANGQQGINYKRNVWHHPLLVFDPASRFLVVDRKGKGNNLEEICLKQPLQLLFPT